MDSYDFDFKGYSVDNIVCYYLAQYFVVCSSCKGVVTLTGGISRTNRGVNFGSIPKVRTMGNVARIKTYIMTTKANHKEIIKMRNFPKEIIEKMVEKQAEQGNERDPSVFFNSVTCDDHEGGFRWSATKEGWDFWALVLIGEDFDTLRVLNARLQRI